MATQRLSTDNDVESDGRSGRGGPPLAQSLTAELTGSPDDAAGSPDAPQATENAEPPTDRPSWGEHTGATPAKKSRGRWLAAGVVLVLAAGGGAWWWTHRSSGTDTSAPTVTTRTVQATATVGTVTSTVSTSGTVTPKIQQEVNFAVSGTVTSVPVVLGQTVKKGQLLATVDTLELKSSLASAKATLAQAKAKKTTDTDASADSTQLAADDASISVAQQKVDQATSDLAAARLTAPVAGQIQELNLSTGQQVSGTGSGSSASGNSAGASGGSGNAGASGIGAGGQSGGSGSGGTGSNSSGSSAQFLIVNTSTWQVDATVSDSQVGLIKKGMQSTISVSSSSASGSGNAVSRFPGGFPGAAGGFGGGFTPDAGGAAGIAGAPGGGQVAAGGNSGAAGAGANPDPAGASGGADSGQAGTAGGQNAAIFGVVSSVGLLATTSGNSTTFPVVIDVTGSRTDLHDGSSVTAVITYAQRNDVLLVPAQAVRQQDGQSVVDKVVGGTVTVVPVTVGQTSGTQVEITKGLSEGDVVQETITTVNRAGSGSTNGRNGYGGGNGTGNGYPGSGAGPGAGGFGGTGGFPGRNRGNG